MSRLRVYQSLWATERRVPGTPEDPIETRFDRVRDAGFDGVCIDLGSMPLEAASALAAQFARTGLAGLVTAFPATDADLADAIVLAQAIAAPFLIVVGQAMPLTVAELIPRLRAWLQIGARAGMALQFETHRGSSLNDLFVAVQVLEAIPELRLSADLSHYVVDRELELPLGPRMEALFEQVLERSDSFQGRVAASHVVQVPLHFPQYAPWLARFEAWWRHGFARWRARAPADADLVFLCELGPPPYALTDARGREFSSRDAEARMLMATARRLWREGD